MNTTYGDEWCVSKQLECPLTQKSIPTGPRPSPIASSLSPGLPVGLWWCCSVGGVWVWGYEVKGCDGAVWGWVPLRPHCLCWRKMGVGAGVAGVGALRRGVSLSWPTPDWCLFSGSGSSGTPGRSSRGCSCGRAASRGSGLGEEGWCWPPESRPGAAGARGPCLKVLPLLLHCIPRPQLRLLGARSRCTACHC